MPTQSVVSIGLGRGDSGVEMEKRWREAAINYGYKLGPNDGVSPMVRDMVEWILKHGVWDRKRGLIGLKENEAA